MPPLIWVVLGEQLAEMINDPLIDVLTAQGVPADGGTGNLEAVVGSQQHGGIERPTAEVVDRDVTPGGRDLEGNPDRRRDRFGHELRVRDLGLCTRLEENRLARVAPVRRMGDPHDIGQSLALALAGFAEHPRKHGGDELADRHEAIAEEQLALAERALRRGRSGANLAWRSAAVPTSSSPFSLRKTADGSRSRPLPSTSTVSTPASLALAATV